MDKGDQIAAPMEVPGLGLDSPERTALLELYLNAGRGLAESSNRFVCLGKMLRGELRLHVGAKFKHQGKNGASELPPYPPSGLLRTIRRMRERWLTSSRCRSRRSASVRPAASKSPTEVSASGWHERGEAGLPVNSIRKKSFVPWGRQRKYCGGTSIPAPSFIGRMPGPARVVEHGPAQSRHVGLARCDDLLGLSGFGDQPDRDGGH